ncbi:FAD-dependent oxidoreductase [Streptomyces sp. NPDC048282]|uniref:FAD-dependent oxidoreductase n=1 Tax=Streptomyces sp. NPDC048282 TaxID=3365528 RepID=UPI00371FDA11
MSGHAVVLGCGIAGLMTAAALAEHVDTVTVVERDTLPDEPVVRKGVPQGHHTHGLLSTGVLAMDALLPGTLRALLDAGAQRVGLGDGTLVHGPHGWMRRTPPGPHFIVGASRALTEHVLRTRLLDRYPVNVLQGAEATGLLGDLRRVRGVRIRHRGSGRTEEVPATLVADTTGRGSRTAADWLPALGLPPVPVSTVDAGLAYTSFTVRVTGPDRLVPCVNLLADARGGRPGRGGFLLRIEQDRWLVTLSGTRGAHPPRDDAGIKDFAHSLAHSLIADLLTHTEREGRVHGYRNTANRRHHYERLPHWPAGLLVLGDAATTFNPVYAQGMTVAALSALALRTALEQHPARELDFAQVQKRVCAIGNLPWLLSTTEDIRYPGATGPRPAPTPALRAIQSLADRLRSTAACDPVAARAFYDLVALRTDPLKLLTVGVALGLLRGPRQAALVEPPLP